MLNVDNFEETKETKSLMLKGESKLLKVYRIPLSVLKYNPQNGRIATWISEYEENGKSLPSDEEQYNNVIEKFIVQANEDALKKTQKNIHRFGQMEAAVVLNNGVLVDGNRRFTALRRLSRDGMGQKFNYIKAVVLSEDSYSVKEVKTLELNLQHAKEERVDYNPIDYLVDVYRDLIADNHDFEPNEYAREVDKKESEVRKDMEVAQLMIEYLDFIHQPNAFSIARKQNINGPLREIPRILQSKHLAMEDVYDAKSLMFGVMASYNGDTSRFVRKMREIVENPKALHSVIENLAETMDDMQSSFADEEQQTSVKETQTVSLPKSITDNVITTVQDQVDHLMIKKARNQPLLSLKRAYQFVGEVDLDAVKRMDEDDKSKMIVVLEQINTQLTKIKGTI